MVVPQIGAFHMAALHVRSRYYRRFPGVTATRFDLTTIKSRWYARGHCEIACVRFA